MKTDDLLRKITRPVRFFDFEERMASATKIRCFRLLLCTALFFGLSAASLHAQTHQVIVSNQYETTFIRTATEFSEHTVDGDFDEAYSVYAAGVVCRRQLIVWRIVTYSIKSY